MPDRLSPTQRAILAALAAAPNRALTYAQLDAVLPAGSAKSSTIRVHVRNLRAKLGDPDAIRVLPGVGIRLVMSFDPGPWLDT